MSTQQRFAVTAFALLFAVGTTHASAQAAKVPMLDSVNKHLQRSAKPAKVSSAKTPTGAAAKTSSAVAAKPARVVQVPAIVSHSSSVASKAAVSASAVSSDSAAKQTPPVRRAAKVAKTKPPTK